MVFGRRLWKKNDKNKDDKNKEEIEVIDFENNQTVKFDEYVKGKSPTKAYKEYSVLSKLLDHFSDPRNNEAKITRQEFALLVGEVIHTLKKREVKNNDENNRTKPVQRSDKERHAEKKEVVEESGRGQGQDDTLCDSPE